MVALLIIYFACAFIAVGVLIAAMDRTTNYSAFKITMCSIGLGLVWPLVFLICVGYSLVEGDYLK